MRAFVALLAPLAWLAPGPLLALPSGITPIAELDTVPRLRHAEVIQVTRDFGRPQVNVALDAWLAPGRIEGLRLWWSDPIDRYPFNDRMHARVDPRFVRLTDDHWRVVVGAGDHERSFDVELVDGRPAAFADVVRADGRRVDHCRARSAQLYAKRWLGLPVGVHSMWVDCTDADGTLHRGELVPPP